MSMPAGSGLDGFHSLCPMTLCSFHPWARQIAAAARAIASSCAAGQGCFPLPELMHSKP